MNKKIIKAIVEDFILMLSKNYFQSCFTIGDKTRYNIWLCAKVYQNGEKEVKLMSFFGEHDLISSSQVEWTPEYEQLHRISNEIKEQLPSYEDLLHRKQQYEFLKLTDLL